MGSKRARLLTRCCYAAVTLISLAAMFWIAWCVFGLTSAQVSDAQRRAVVHYAPASKVSTAPPTAEETSANAISRLPTAQPKDANRTFSPTPPLTPTETEKEVEKEAPHEEHIHVRRVSAAAAPENRPKENVTPTPRRDISPTRVLDEGARRESRVPVDLPRTDGAQSSRRSETDKAPELDREQRPRDPEGSIRRREHDDDERYRYREEKPPVRDDRYRDDEKNRPRTESRYSDEDRYRYRDDDRYRPKKDDRYKDRAEDRVRTRDDDRDRTDDRYRPGDDERYRDRTEERDRPRDDDRYRDRTEERDRPRDDDRDRDRTEERDRPRYDDRDRTDDRYRPRDNDKYRDKPDDRYSVRDEARYIIRDDEKYRPREDEKYRPPEDRYRPRGDEDYLSRDVDRYRPRDGGSYRYRDEEKYRSPEDKRRPIDDDDEYRPRASERYRLKGDKPEVDPPGRYDDRAGVRRPEDGYVDLLSTAGRPRVEQATRSSEIRPTSSRYEQGLRSEEAVTDYDVPVRPKNRERGRNEDDYVRPSKVEVSPLADDDGYSANSRRYIGGKDGYRTGDRREEVVLDRRSSAAEDDVPERRYDDARRRLPDGGRRKDDDYQTRSDERPVRKYDDEELPRRKEPVPRPADTRDLRTSSSTRDDNSRDEYAAPVRRPYVEDLESRRRHNEDSESRRHYDEDSEHRRRYDEDSEYRRRYDEDSEHRRRPGGQRKKLEDVAVLEGRGKIRSPAPPLSTREVLEFAIKQSDASNSGTREVAYPVYDPRSLNQTSVDLIPPSEWRGTTHGVRRRRGA